MEAPSSRKPLGSLSGIVKKHPPEFVTIPDTGRAGSAMTASGWEPNRG